MVRFMNRSIDLLDELARATDNVFKLNRRGYVYATASAAHAQQLAEQGAQAARQGAGPLRVHESGSTSRYPTTTTEGFDASLDGADLILDRALIRQHFAYLADDCVAVLHARRCGWFSGQQLGMYLLEEAREHGTRLLPARLGGVDVAAGRVQAVHVSTQDRTYRVRTARFVNAAGPLVADVCAWMGVQLPIFSERHLKASFHDVHGVLARDAPLVIWEDRQRLAWNEADRALLSESDETRWLLQEFPASVHTRPEGGGGSDNVLVLWPYDAEPVEVVFPIEVDPVFPEVALRGIARAVPGMRRYLDPFPKAFVLTAHVTGGSLPVYASSFVPSRYDDPAYAARFESWGSKGQL
jgi:hypothetical protein